MTDLPMYASVIPALRLPKAADGRYDYAVPEDLTPHVRPGSWVVVPWRGRHVDGIVADVRAEPSHVGRIRPIVGLAARSPLPDTLVALVDGIAARYYCSPSTVVKAFLPSTPKTKVLKAPEETVYASSSSAVSRDTGACVREVVRYADARWRDERTTDVVGACLDRGRDALVLVPHAHDIDRTVSVLRAATDADVVPVHGGLSAAKHRSAWLQLLAATGPVVVVGTRPAVLAPVSHAGAIIVHEADSADLKQYDQNPRYDARTVARERAKIENADLLFMSHAPRVEEYALVGDEGFALREQPLNTDEAVLVDVNAPTRDTDVAPLSPPLLEAAKNALHGGKKVLILHNRRGSASAMLCRECGRVLRCPTCAIAFTVHDGRLECHRCGTKMPAPAACPACGGDMRTYGTGATALERRLHAALPDARIARVDAETRTGDLHDADAIVGTRSLLHDTAETSQEAAWGCVAATSLDDLLAHPGFRVAEDAWRVVRTLRDIAAASGGTCYLQTVDPENPAVRSLLLPYIERMAQELDARRGSGYPPEGTLIAVTMVSTDEAEAEAMGTRLVAAMKRKFGGIERFAVAGPLRPSPPFRHGKWRRTVVIKCARPSPALEAALRALPEDHIVDRDPDSIG